jgi:uncharacterized membrane protein YeaQ/YmgE (transglycosylase-associated protein family)
METQVLAHALHAIEKLGLRAPTGPCRQRPVLRLNGMPAGCCARRFTPNCERQQFSNEEGEAMSIIWAIIIGFIVGLVAKFLMPGRDPGGFIVTTLLGIVGALVATFLGQAMGIYAAGQSAGFIGAVIGAIIVLLIYHVVRGRRRVL